MQKLGFLFDGKIYMFQRLPMSLSSSSSIFTEFMQFPIWAMKKKRFESYYKEVDESMTNLNDFIKDADIIKKGSRDMLAIFFYCSDDALGRNPVKDKA